MSRFSHWLRRRGLLAPKPVFPVDPGIGRHRLSPPIEVATSASTEMQERLFDQVARVWDLLGEADPHWSVLTEPQYRADKIAATKDGFYDSGRDGIVLIEAFFARNGMRLDHIRTLLEIGCGVGRMTGHFAKRFDRVVAVDVSQRHLAYARERLVTLGLSNVDYVQIRGVEDFESLPECDLMFSEIVLHHNPPPVQLAILRHLAGKLSPGGFCLFQAATYIANYRFDPEAYLARTERSLKRAARGEHMEMHPIPQREIFRILQDAGIDLIEVHEDTAGGLAECLSHTFFGRKRPLHGGRLH
ncbi:MAG: class I SAM-dependent methyltransferase [Xanthobacteraceae bacterium]